MIFQNTKNGFFFDFFAFSPRFGCKIVSQQTGIILNDGMDDFSIPGKNNSYGMPPSPANFIKPTKMPLSSMCPTIMLDENGDVELVLGAAGGSKITSSVAYVRFDSIHFKRNKAQEFNVIFIAGAVKVLVLQ